MDLDVKLDLVGSLASNHQRLRPTLLQQQELENLYEEEVSNLRCSAVKEAASPQKHGKPDPLNQIKRQVLRNL